MVLSGSDRSSLVVYIQIIVRSSFTLLNNFFRCGALEGIAITKTDVANLILLLEINMEFCYSLQKPSLTGARLVKTEMHEVCFTPTACCHNEKGKCRMIQYAY